MDGDEEPLRVEAVDLDEPVVVRDGAVDDEEDEVVVVVDLRPLAELLGVLDRERVELEDVAQDLEVAGLRFVEVEPEELAAREQPLDRLAAELHPAAARLVDHMAEGGAGVAFSDVGHERMLTARAATRRTVIAASPDSGHQRLGGPRERHRVGRAEGDRVRERDVQVVPEARRPTLAREVLVIVLRELEVGRTPRLRKRAGDGAAVVELPEGEPEGHGIGEPDRTPADEQLASRDVRTRVVDQGGDEHDDACEREHPHEGQQDGHHPPPVVAAVELAEAEEQAEEEEGVRHGDHEPDPPDLPSAQQVPVGVPAHDRQEDEDYRRAEREGRGVVAGLADRGHHPLLIGLGRRGLLGHASQHGLAAGRITLSP